MELGSFASLRSFITSRREHQRAELLALLVGMAWALCGVRVELALLLALPGRAPGGR